MDFEQKVKNHIKLWKLLYNKACTVLCRKYLKNKLQSQQTFFSTPMIRIRTGFGNAEPHPVAMEMAKKRRFFTLSNNSTFQKYFYTRLRMFKNLLPT
jgi:hypothetical protein